VIVGNGLIAGAFKREFASDPAATLFASGVSNSAERRAAEFAREEALLRATLRRDPAPIVYFSTCSVLDVERAVTPYVRHKLQMEALARTASSHVILRLPQVVGRTDNPHTLTNFLRSQIVSGVRFEVWENAWRNLIDVDDAAAIATRMIRDRRYWNRTVNIASPHTMPVPELVAAYERVLGVVANCQRVDRGERYAIDVGQAMEVADSLGIRSQPDYIERVIRKYYGTESRT